MSDEILIAIIAAISSITAVFISNRNQAKRIKRIAADTKDTREQVSNNHIDETGKPINLREEQDERHEHTTAAIAALTLKVDELLEGYSSLGGSIRRLWKHASGVDEQIEEMTEPRDRYMPPVKHRRAD